MYLVYHSGRKSKERVGLNMNTRTVLTFPGINGIVFGVGFFLGGCSFVPQTVFELPDRVA